METHGTPLLKLEDGLAGSGHKTEKNHLNIEKVTALFVIMPTHYLIYGDMRCGTNTLKTHMCAIIKKLKNPKLRANPQ